MTTKIRTIELEDYDCCTCGTTMWLEADYVKRRRNDKNTFYCPNGHHQVFGGKTEAQKLSAKLDQANTRLANEQQRTRNAKAEAEQHKRNTTAQKAAKTRLKNKIAKGKCPCCSSEFVNLAKHMAKQHPEYQPDINEP